MKSTIQLFAVILAFSSCSTIGNKKLDQKMSEAPTVNSRSELQTEARNSIDNAINLTDDQKAKLTQLRYSVSTQSDEFNRQSLELRSILLKDLLSSNYNAKEVGLIKTRMRKLEERRLSMTFDSVEKANVILGRQAAANHRVMRELLGEREYKE